MNARENAHQLIDALPEDRLSDAVDYLNELNDTDDLSAETHAAIKEGLDDIETGRTVALDQFRRTRGL